MKRSPDVEIGALHEIWEREFHNTEFDWPTVQDRLHDAASPIGVVEVNSRSPGTLDYNNHQQDGLNVIAVGGFSLSRGLTLEGLMVSYFMRNSMMYDTLMQMGAMVRLQTRLRGPLPHLDAGGCPGLVRTHSGVHRGAAR